jgi:hypothetical protein
MFGVRLDSKLRAILLMEADFNAMNKEVYGVQMLDNARRYKLIPEEIFSEQNRTADDGGLAKTLFYDIARQTRTPAAIASVDASNCYDRIAHTMASLIFHGSLRNAGNDSRDEILSANGVWGLEDVCRLLHRN